MSNVISFAAARRAREVVPVEVLSYDVLVDKITSIAHKYVSTQASYLLVYMARMFRDGHNELSYTFLCAELRITTKTLVKYILELEDQKMLRIRRSRVGKTNATNMFEIDFRGPLGAPMPKLKTPKKFNELGTGNFPVGGEGVLEKVKRYNINIISNKKLIPKGIGRFATPEFSSISEALEHSEKRVVRKRAEKVAKVIKVGNQITFAGTKAAWTQSMLRHYPSVPPVVLSTKEFCIFKQRILPFLQTDNLSTIFDFFISSWSYLRENKFRWLRAKGQDIALAPSLPELMRYWKVFAQAFADSKMAGAANAQKGERSETEKLRDELAIAKAGRAQLEVDHRNMEERLRKAERMAAAPLPKDDKPTLSLSARRKAADERYNEGSDIPTWK